MCSVYTIKDGKSHTIINLNECGKMPINEFNSGQNYSPSICLYPLLELGNLEKLWTYF